tara:strand:+ start:318 stop:578 length:261 start_codon:yes stop_codon:yes gene_type:complete
MRIHKRTIVTKLVPVNINLVPVPKVQPVKRVMLVQWIPVRLQEQGNMLRLPVPKELGIAPVLIPILKPVAVTVRMDTHKPIVLLET